MRVLEMSLGYERGYYGGGNRGSMAILNTLSTRLGISWLSSVPPVSKQGLLLAYISQGTSSESSIKSKPNSCINMAVPRSRIPCAEG